MEPADGDQGELSAISLNDTAVLVTAVEDIFRYDASVTTLMIIAYAVIFIMGLVGNAFVLGVVFRTPRMKTTTNYLLVNLAVADILVLVICVPANLIGNILLRKSAANCSFNSFFVSSSNRRQMGYLRTRACSL